MAVPALGLAGRDVTVVVPVSDAEDRLVAAWSRLAKDVVTAALSHNDVYATGGWKVPDRFTVSPNIRCQPAATGTEGEVRVPVTAIAVAAVGAAPAQTFHASPVRLLEYDPQKVSPAPVQATVTQVGANAVLVSIGAPPVGTYVGFVLDEAGAIVAPFVIYIDGL
jgi:hypothetical protein